MSEILSRLIDVTMVNTNEINDFSVGSTIRSIYEAVSVELESYYMLGRQNILWGIEKGVLNAFNFKKREAKRAFGQVTIEFHTTTQEPTYIPRGTSFDSSRTNKEGKRMTFVTEKDYFVPKGSVTAKIDVYCTQAGTRGNVLAGDINRALDSISNLKRVYNRYDILTGKDEESIESVKKRFHGFVESRGRATIKALDYGTRQVEDISGVYIREEIGYVRIYCHDSNGNLKEETKKKVENAIEDYRPAGIKLEVYPVEKIVVPVHVTITTTNAKRMNSAMRKKIETIIRNYLNSQTVSQDLILNDLLQVIMSIDDDLIYDAEIHNIEENIGVRDEEVIRAGDITLDIE